MSPPAVSMEVVGELFCFLGFSQESLPLLLSLSGDSSSGTGGGASTGGGADAAASNGEVSFCD